MAMHRGIIATLLGWFLWMLGGQAGGAEWYKVTAVGQVTFTFSEEWAISKGVPPSSIVLGDGTLTLEYLDGNKEQIAFQDSTPEVSLFIASGGIGGSGGTGEISGTNVFTQTASL